MQLSKPDKKYRVCAGRPYGNDGKKQWVELGRAVLWDDGGISMEMHSAPVGAWFDGKLSFFDSDEQREAAPRQSANRPAQQRNEPTRSQNSGSRSAPMHAPPVDDFDDTDLPF